MKHCANYIKNAGLAEGLDNTINARMINISGSQNYLDTKLVFIQLMYSVNSFRNVLTFLPPQTNV